MTFDRTDFDQTLRDIEHYLGYLKGNELAHDYLMTMWGNLRQQYADQSGHPYTLSLEWEYKFPCPDQRFAVRPGVNWTPTVYVNPGDTVDWDAYVREVQKQTDVAYHEGVGWASGLAGYLRSVCDRFVKPDVGVLRDTMLDLERDVVMQLTDAPNDDWARLGDLNTRWTGDAAASFNEFYANYNDVIARAARFAYLVNLGAAATTQVVSSAQVGALDYVHSMRDGLVAQLDQWAHVGWKPTDPVSSEFPEWVTDLFKVADNSLTVVADYVPVIGEVTDVRDNLKHIASLVGSVADLVGAELPRAPRRVPVQSSTEIYSALTDALTDDYLQGFEKALDRLNSGGSGGSIEQQAFSGQGVLGLMDADVSSGAWSVPTIPPGPLTDEDDTY